MTYTLFDNIEQVVSCSCRQLWRTQV